MIHQLSSVYYNCQNFTFQINFRSQYQTSSLLDLSNKSKWVGEPDQLSGRFGRFGSVGLDGNLWAEGYAKNTISANNFLCT